MNSAYKKELHSEAWEKFAHKKSLKTAENKIVRLIILDREKLHMSLITCSVANSKQQLMKSI